MAIGTASNFKVADCLINGRSNQRVAKRPTGGGGDLPAPPSGFAYIVNADGSYLINADAAYILGTV